MQNTTETISIERRAPVNPRWGVFYVVTIRWQQNGESKSALGGSNVFREALANAYHNARCIRKYGSVAKAIQLGEQLAKLHSPYEEWEMDEESEYDFDADTEADVRRADDYEDEHKLAYR